MLKRFSAKRVSLFVGALAVGSLGACGQGLEPVDELRGAVVENKAAVIGQADFDSYTNAVNIKACTFTIAAGNATFTPSKELSKVLYGDDDVSKHKSTFSVPPISNPSITVDINSFNAEMANTGLTLAGANATLKVAFNGLLKIKVAVPLLGTLPADLQIKSSSLSAALAYDKATARAKVASVTTRFDITTKNCGGFGWCNGIVDSLLKANLATWIEAPLRDALNKALDDDDVTDGLNEGLVLMFNAKEKATPAWSMVANTLELSTGAFRFTAERTVP